MRKIKFRGKRKDNGGWVYGSLVQYSYSGGEVYDIITGSGEKRYQVIPESIGQYTRLKDSERQEIYEGDILTDDCDHAEFKGIVRYKNGAFWLNTGDRYTSTYLNVIAEDNKIFEYGKIGNEFENSGLL